MKKYLNTHYNDVVLFFHSQGADIGERALQGLNKYKNRLKVITIGGMVNISNSLAAEVSNFHSYQDYVSRGAKATFGTLSELVGLSKGSKTVISFDCNKGGILACHDSNAYLEAAEVKEAAKKFVKQKCYLN